MTTQTSKTQSTYSAFPHAMHDHMLLLTQCMTICSSCAKMCIDKGHKPTAVLCGECADVCGLAIKAHSSDSEFNDEIMDLCTKVCTRCSEECKKQKVDHCQQCSEICQKCATACKEC